jgi:hypothetical protein
MLRRSLWPAACGEDIHALDKMSMSMSMPVRRSGAPGVHEKTLIATFDAPLPAALCPKSTIMSG